MTSIAGKVVDAILSFKKNNNDNGVVMFAVEKDESGFDYRTRVVCLEVIDLITLYIRNIDFPATSELSENDFVDAIIKIRKEIADNVYFHLPNDAEKVIEILKKNEQKGNDKWTILKEECIDLWNTYIDELGVYLILNDILKSEKKLNLYGKYADIVAEKIK